MKKNIACPNCKGKGYNTVVTGNRSDYCGVMNVVCPECNGTGLKLADMTNADRIRATSDDDMARILYERPWCNHHCEHTGEDECLDCIARYLQRPAEEVIADEKV